MRDKATRGLLLLLLDAVLGVALWAGLALLRRPTGSPGVAGLWAWAAVKWLGLRAFASVLVDGKPPAALRRLLAVLCLMAPALESGRAFVASERYAGPRPDLTAVVLAPAAAALACVVWEQGLGGSKKAGPDGVGVATRQLLLRTLRLFRADSAHLLAAFGFLVLGVVCDSLIPCYQGDVIDMLRELRLHPGFAASLGRLVLLSVGSAAFSGVRGGIFLFTLGRLNRRLKLLLFRRLLRQEVHFFEENNPGQLSARLHSDVDRMGRTVALNANAALRSSLKLVLMLALMLRLSWELTVLTFIEMPLLAVVQNKYSALRREMKDQMQDCHALGKDLASQAVGAIRTVRSCRAEADELRRYRRVLERLGAVRRRTGIYSAVFLIIRRLVSLLIKLLMLLQARSLIASGHLSIGSLVSFFLYQKPMSGSLKELLYCYGETVSTVGVISKVFGYLDRTPACRPEGALAPAELQGRIVFEDVTFAYPSSPRKPALKSVSVELRAGAVTALVGPSGGGKTSFVSLLKRLYEPQEGRILLDGEPLHRYRLKYLQQQVALVSQNPVMFSGSRRYNIEYGLAGCGAEAALDAARRIDALDLVSDMEAEDDADVGERGVRLAESQKQSIAIARALVRNPRVIVLDEATSKLDVEAQHAVLREVLSSRRTVLVVTHQLRVAENADHIVFLEDGAVVEEGTHQQLMARRGRYYWLREETSGQQGAPANQSRTD